MLRRFPEIVFVCAAVLISMACGLETQKCASACSQAMAEARHRCGNMEEPAMRDRCGQQAEADGNACLKGCSSPASR